METSEAVKSVESALTGSRIAVDNASIVMHETTSPDKFVVYAEELLAGWKLKQEPVSKEEMKEKKLVVEDALLKEVWNKN